MKFLSICSGIEAASVASKPLGWEPLAFSEIEPFPRAVLQHHYPDVPLHGDFTELKDQPWIVDADLLCGGTPCQAFSVAGLRKSLSDDRGNLSLQFIHLADAIDNLRSAAGRQPAYVVWENVPGVLSTNDNAFGAFLGGLCGRDAAIPEPEGGWTSSGVVDGPTRVAAWRTMDAQFFGVAQRRRRVFVLAHGGAGKWAAADALLPITEGMSGNPAPRRQAGKVIAPTLDVRAGRSGETSFHTSGGLVECNALAPTLSARTKGGGGLGTDFELDGGLVAGTLGANHGNIKAEHAWTGQLLPEVTGTLATNTGPRGHDAGNFASNQGVDAGFLIPEVANPLSARMHKGVNTTMDEGQTMVPVAFKMRGGGNGTGERGGAVGTQGGVGYLGQEECAFTLSTTEDQHVAVPLAFHENQRGEITLNETAGSLGSGGGKPGQGYPAAIVPDAFAFKPAHFTRDKDGAPPLSADADKGDQEAVVCVPQVVPTHDVVGAMCAESGPNTHGSRGVSGSQTLMNGYCQPTTSMQVRRLTTVECSRLQGFPDTYCHIEGKTRRKVDPDEAAYLMGHGLKCEEVDGQCYTRVAADGPIYKALGNSWAVPNMRWIFRRIQKVDDILKKLAV